MRIVKRVSSATALALFWSMPIVAAPQAHGNPHVTTPSPHAAPATQVSAAPHGAPATHGNPHTTTTAVPTTTSSGTTSSSVTSTTTSTTGSTTPTTTTSNPVALKIASHPQLAAKVNTLLPSGMTLAAASKGFRNQGQFIAALHVSKNLNLPFTTLKATMLGTPVPATTGTSGTTTTGTTTSTTTGTTTAPTPMSLGQAIHKLRASVDATAAANTATVQATNDVNSTTK